MRNATFDKKQVTCKNGSTLGFDKRTAQVGDIVQWVENGERCTGRMIARVVYAPSFEYKGEVVPAIQNWLAVARLAPSLNVCMRWVNPDDVTRVEALRPEHIDAMELFTGEWLKTGPKEHVLQCVSECWSSSKKYLKWRHNIDAKTA